MSFMLANIVEGANVRVIQCRNRARLELKALQRVALLR